MSIDFIQREFQQNVSDKVRVASEGVDRYRVDTPFMFDDGDHLLIVLKKEGEQWVLTDEGHTYMRLSYDIDESSVRRGTRQKIISHALSTFEIEDNDGELVLGIPDNRYGDALYAFVQGLLKIADVSFEEASE
ncbi:MAG: DUF1828 domain-containing protein [Gammaproteobacteria bacterium]|nr:DUF1828 domain-containing protein [Gammaproteobacteria bacterium]